MKKQQLPSWVWIVITILSISTFLLYVSYNNSISIDKYNDLLLEYADSVEDYGEQALELFALLDCYQRGSSTCQALIQKGWSPLVAKQYSHGSCTDDWFPVAGTSFCCPDPISKIVSDKCVSG